MDIDELNSKTNFDAVMSYIENIITNNSKVASMKVLKHVYGGDSEDKLYRNKLKQKIQNEFLRVLQFVQLSTVCAEIVFSKSIFDNTEMPQFEPQPNIVSVAKQLREDMICFCNTVPEDKWLPTFSKKFTYNREEQNNIIKSERHQKCHMSTLHWMLTLLSVLSNFFGQNFCVSKCSYSSW